MSRPFRLVRMGALLGAVACGGRASSSPPAPASSAAALPVTLPPVTPELRAQAAARIRHVVVIMQENRSFDEYFGTYPVRDRSPAVGTGRR